MQRFSSINFTETPLESSPCVILFINNSHHIISDTSKLPSKDLALITEQIKTHGLDADSITRINNTQSKISYLCVRIDDKLDCAYDYQCLGAKTFKKLRDNHDLDITIYWPDLEKQTIDIRVCAMVIKGFYSASYTFDAYKNNTTKKDAIKLTHLCHNIKSFKTTFTEYAAIVEGEFIAKDLMNEPANILTPIEFCNRIKQLSGLGLEVEILDEAMCRKEKMYALLSVGQGSAQPSRLACIKWQGSKQKDDQPVALVGKGVCYDSGGINLKRAMLTEMKFDMGGAAAVVGAMASIAKQKTPVNVIGIVALTENMTGSQAYRPSDIISSRSGKTIEVLNTDAEGRLILADAIDYATDFKPKAIIDIATLTGAIIVALGHEYAGLFSNNRTLTEKINIASERSGEKVWELPLDKTFDKLMDSPIADLQNIPTSSGQAGSITAAQFLQRFVKDLPWAHIDIAGTAWNAATDIHGKGPSGYGVSLLSEMVKEYV